jgi:hypothetical protein
LYAGFEFNPPWLTIRGGYTYDKNDTDSHTVAIQLYRLFSYTF